MLRTSPIMEVPLVLNTQFLPLLQRKIVNLQDFQDHLYLQKLADADRPPNYICLGCGTNCHQEFIQTTEKDIQDMEREIIRWIEIEFDRIQSCFLNNLNFE